MTRPLEAALMGLFFLAAIFEYLWRRSLKNYGTYFLKLLRLPGAWGAAALLSSYIVYNEFMFSSALGGYTTGGLSIFNLPNIFIKSSSLLFNPAVLNPTAVGFSLTTLNFVFVIYYLFLIAVCFSGVGFLGALPALTYLIYSATEAVWTNALVYTNMVHYFKLAFLLGYLFLALTIYQWIAQSDEIRTTRYSSPRVIALLNVLWIFFIFGQTAIFEPRTPALPHTVMTRSSQNTPVISFSLGKQDCDSTYCAMFFTGFRPPDPFATLLSDIHPIQLPEHFALKGKYGMLPDVLGTGYFTLFGQALPEGQYRFELVRFNVLPEKVSTLVYKIVPLSSYYWARLFRRW